MLARIALAPSALVDLGAGLPVRTAKQNHLELIRTLSAHGCLIFANPSETASFVKVVRGADLPPGTSQKWQALIEEFLKRRPKRVLMLEPDHGVAFEEITSLDQLSSVWATKAGIAIVDDSLSEKLGLPEEDGWVSLPEQGLDVTAAWAATHCPRLTHFRNLKDSGWLPPGGARTEFWDDVLGPVASLSHKAVIVDRYLFSGRGRPDLRHLTWLMEGLHSALRPESCVTLIAEQPNLREPEYLIDLLARQWPKQATTPVQIEIVLLPEKLRGGGQLVFPHDRHIRFDVGCAVIPFAGFDRLREPRLRDPDGMKWSYVWAKNPLQALLDAEHRVTSNAKAISATCRLG